MDQQLSLAIPSDAIRSNLLIDNVDSDRFVETFIQKALRGARYAVDPTRPRSTSEIRLELNQTTDVKKRRALFREWDKAFETDADSWLRYRRDNWDSCKHLDPDRELIRERAKERPDPREEIPVWQVPFGEREWLYGRKQIPPCGIALIDRFHDDSFMWAFFDAVRADGTKEGIDWDVTRNKPFKAAAEQLSNELYFIKERFDDASFTAQKAAALKEWDATLIEWAKARVREADETLRTWPDFCEVEQHFQYFKEELAAWFYLRPKLPT